MHASTKSEGIIECIGKGVESQAFRREIVRNEVVVRASARSSTSMQDCKNASNLKQRARRMSICILFVAWSSMLRT